MLFTITRDQYELYKDTAGPCRQYIIDKFPRICTIVDTFNQYFGAENVDIYANDWKQKSLLLTLLEDYEQSSRLVNRSLEEFLDATFTSNNRSGIMANLAIYVHWPSVVVTNERGQSTVVTDLYAKVPLSPNGKMFEGFSLTRATYTYEQYSSGYMHSHVNGINPDPSFFLYPCLGTGPLIQTQRTLMSDRNSDLWDLFCAELDRYVHVESIAGVPYRHLDRIGTGRFSSLNYDGSRVGKFSCIILDNELNSLFVQFFKYVLTRKKMKFAFVDGLFVSSYTETAWLLKLSALFIKFFAMMRSMNKTNVDQRMLLSKGLLIEVKMNNGVLYTISSNSRNLSNYRSFQDLHVLYFKGEDIKTHVDDPVNFTENTYFVLDPVLSFAFLDQCLNYLNIYEHEKITNTIQDNQEESEVIVRDSSDSTTRSQVKNSFPNYPIGETRVTLSL